jgi:hypothetical protein
LGSRRMPCLRSRGAKPLATAEVSVIELANAALVLPLPRTPSLRTQLRMPMVLGIGMAARLQFEGTIKCLGAICSRGPRETLRIDELRRTARAGP